VIKEKGNPNSSSLNGVAIYRPLGVNAERICPHIAA
jgi:hypothetical protein